MKMKTSDPERTCFYCEASTTNKVRIEYHHIFGKVNSPIGVNMCKNCHHNLHDPLQKELPKKVREQKAPHPMNVFYSLLLWSKHLQLLGEEGEKLARQAISKEVKGNGDSVHEDVCQEEESGQAQNN